MTTVPNPVSTTLQAIYQRRQVTALCLSLSVGLALIAALRLMPLAVMTSPLLGAALFLLHGALDPSRQGFLHHRRIRALGIIATILAAASIGLIAPTGATPPLLFAMAIAFRHHRGSTKLHVAAAREVAELQQKIIALESRRLLDLSLSQAHHPLRDKAPKAS